MGNLYKCFELSRWLVNKNLFNCLCLSEFGLISAQFSIFFYSVFVDFIGTTIYVKNEQIKMLYVLFIHPSAHSSSTSMSLKNKKQKLTHNSSTHRSTRTQQPFSNHEWESPHWASCRGTTEKTTCPLRTSVFAHMSPLRLHALFCCLFAPQQNITKMRCTTWKGS